MSLIISQTHILAITGIEDINEPEWFDLRGEVCQPRVKYSEAERQCPNKKGSDLKKKKPMETKRLGTIFSHANKNKTYNG